MKSHFSSRGVSWAILSFMCSRRHKGLKDGERVRFDSIMRVGLDQTERFARIAKRGDTQAQLPSALKVALAGNFVEDISLILRLKSMTFTFNPIQLNFAMLNTIECK